MKALVLAAGFGTRLLPFTRETPKPLFTIDGRPLLDIVIRKLAAAGAEAVAVNTHHLHDRIEAFLAAADYPIPVHLRHEPVILGTGGAIRNLSDFWDDRPFWVVNADIYTDIDFRAVADFHRSHPHPATLALVDDPEFNSVRVDHRGRVTAFETPGERHRTEPPGSLLTFTGIQVLDPVILDHLPPSGFAGSVDAFRDMLDQGMTLAAWRDPKARWSDMGTPERYRRQAMEAMAEAHLARSGATPPQGRLHWEPVAGDGSDRTWWRVMLDGRTAVMVDHGIRNGPATAEVDAFVDIGRHLARRGVPVPRILAADTFSGLVLLEDLGSTHLADRAAAAGSAGELARIYRDVLDLLTRMSVEGAKGFDPSWTYQTRSYDREVILERECRYFMEAFVSGLLGLDAPFAPLAGEFEALADRILALGLTGFMHRDFQSRNVMVTPSGYGVIDFQGGRLGPAPYDAAALLIDPYVDLADALAADLRDGFVRRYAALAGRPAETVRRCYDLCSLSRNLQILGAFGFLSRVKGKTRFEAFIPSALRRLKGHPLLRDPGPEFPGLAGLVARLPDR